MPVGSIPSLVGAPGTGYGGVCYGKTATAQPALSFIYGKYIQMDIFKSIKQNRVTYIYTHTPIFPPFAWHGAGLTVAPCSFFPG